MRPSCLTSLLVLALLTPSAQAAATLDDALLLAAPKASKDAIAMAVQAMQCAERHGMPAAERLAVIDYSLPSTQPRLWVFDLSARALMYQERVAHGRNSGDTFAQRFSNLPGSFASSLGLFRTGEAYVGSNGYSLRMDGLEPGINDKARERAIVIHGADYVSDDFVQSTGRIGRSLGCPAVRQGVAHALIDSLQGGQFVFSYYPDRQWLARSRLVHCQGGASLQTVAAAAP